VIATKAELDAWVSASPLRGRNSHQFIRTQTLLTPPKDFLGGVKQMAMLRDEMMQLRSDLKSSLTLLTERIRVVSDVLMNDRAKVADGQSARGMAGDLDTLLENAISASKLGTLRKQ
jgi:hypothetical protein